MHSDGEFLDMMRHRGDPEADLLLSGVLGDDLLAKQLYAYLPMSKNEVRQHHLLRQVQEFLLQPPMDAAWLDRQRLSNGQRFFKKFALDIMTLLGAMSLPYCYAASPGNKAIYFTEKMRKSPGKRLLETAHFIIEVMKDGSFSADGAAMFEIQKTRLIHAMVRHFILNRTAWDSSWGLPINQEDMAGTNLAFSYIIISGMENSDFVLNTADVEDFLYTWRFIGYQLRIDEALLPSTKTEAKLLEEVIRTRHFRQSAEGPLLTNELIQHYKESFPAVAAYFVDSQIRYFIGPEVSALLGLQPQPLKDYIVQAMNKIRKKINRNFTNPFSYKIMLRNHFKLKEKYSTRIV